MREGKLALNMTKTPEEFRAEIEKVLVKLREGIAEHGGEIELAACDVATGKVSIRLKGACVGCPYSDLTLKVGVEETLREFIPEVTEVVAAA